MWTKNQHVISDASTNRYVTPCLEDATIINTVDLSEPVEMTSTDYQ